MGGERILQQLKVAGAVFIESHDFAVEKRMLER
jgi:hypothetical protein